MAEHPELRLISPLLTREIAGRYRGSAFGMFWSLLTPLFMLGVYTFVFGSIFNSRWNGAEGQAAEGTGEFAIVLFAGLIIFQLFSEVVGRSPSLVVSNVSYVKKVVFPLEVLSIVAVGSALFHAVVSLAVLFVFEVVLMGRLPWTIVLLPLIVVPFLVLTLGLSWFLAATGVFFRDIGQLLGPLITALMFLSPIFFPASSLPAWVQGWHLLNPLALPVEQVRAVVIFGTMPDWAPLGLYFVVALIIAWLGYAFFAKTRKGFADVL